MLIEPLSIPGAWKITPRQFTDPRGAFMEFFKADQLVAATGRAFSLAQGNRSVSLKGVLRGVHFADTPPGQSKYVTCASGAIWDVVADLRVGSPTFGQWEGVQLDDADCAALMISEGLGHAFVTLSDKATVTYLCSTGYNPAAEHGVHPLCPDLGIGWPAEADLGAPLLLSEKDAAAPGLQQARTDGLLPDYGVCTQFYEATKV